jgi:hypothetical protein
VLAQDVTLRQARFKALWGAQMAFENLSVDRVILHEIYRRLDDKSAKPPTYGDESLVLDPAAMDVFRERVIAALGSQSQSLEMDIVKVDATSAVRIARDLLAADGDLFATVSRRFPDKLTEAQQTRDLPGGIVIVFTGSAGHPAQSIVGVIKAETHPGFQLTSTMKVQYLKDLFLTPQTKLYKIGLFSFDGKAPRRLPTGWKLSVFDSSMSNGHREKAAQYFYETFLGCSLPTNAAMITKRFYDHTRAFIKKAQCSEEQRSDMLTSLYTYVKIDQSPTLETRVFSENYLERPLRESYGSFMREQAFPEIAVSKDIGELKNQLKRRRLLFSRNIQVSGPPDAFSDLVVIEKIPLGAPAGSGSGGWTRITIKDHIRDQE